MYSVYVLLLDENGINRETLNTVEPSDALLLSFLHYTFSSTVTRKLSFAIPCPSNIAVEDSQPHTMPTPAIRLARTFMDTTQQTIPNVTNITFEENEENQNEETENSTTQAPLEIPYMDISESAADQPIRANAANDDRLYHTIRSPIPSITNDVTENYSVHQMVTNDTLENQTTIGTGNLIETNATIDPSTSPETMERERNTNIPNSDVPERILQYTSLAVNTVPKGPTTIESNEENIQH
ncbi:hypothetical protein I4U23_013503 [Adineta vaga]|nr:hypothetical protein I4U23_013503 [Adineta vaga]